MSYNVGAFHKYIPELEENIAVVASIIKGEQADAVAINELDSCNRRCESYQLKLLSDALGGCYYYFGKALDYKGGAYGNGIVLRDKNEVISSYTYPLPEEPGHETRSVSVIETRKYVLMATHIDYYGKPYVLDQVKVFNEMVRSRYSGYKKPVFLCGDMNATPESEVIRIFKEDWTILSANENSAGGNNPATRCIDYIFHYSGSAPIKLVGGHTISYSKAGDVTKASDHLPIYVDIKM